MLIKIVFFDALLLSFFRLIEYVSLPTHVQLTVATGIPEYRIAVRVIA